MMNEETIFATARQWKDSPERRTFLDQACAGKPELRAQIESLLRADAAAGSLLEHPAGLNETTNLNSDRSARSGAATGEVSLSFLSSSDKPGSIGRLGTYEISEVIGRGGMGIVLRGLDSKLNRVVAIKALAPDFAINAMARKRFLREAQAAAAVSHDHVVTIHAVDDDAAAPFLVMECVVGQSLQQKIDRVGALQTTEILRIGMQIAMGLMAAHKQGLIHRDIKPANILLENGVERVKITDFGLARAVDDVGITQSGVIAGTPQYMSPEQAMGDPIDQRSDLFSLGSVLYTMCTGRPAFRADTTIAVIRRVCDDSPRPISELNPEIPDWLVAIINKLLAKKPADRFQTAADVADLLEQHLAVIQQSSAASGHRAAARRRHAALARETANTDRSDLIWSWVGILTLCLALFGWGARFFVARHNPDGSALTAEIERESVAPLSQSHELETRKHLSQVSPEGLDWKNSPEETKFAPADISATTNVTSAHLALAPFTPQQAAEYQNAWAKELRVPIEYTNSMGMKFRLIPPGEFMMGLSPTEITTILKELEENAGTDFDKFSVQSSGPRHRVRLTEPFYMGEFEVTVGQYQQFADSPQGQAIKTDGTRFIWKQFVREETGGRQAVVGLSWNEADAFCQWLQEREKLSYDLPTEAQWEYACRAGSQTSWSFGDDPALLEVHAIYGQREAIGPAAIGLKSANPFGLFDMHGNVDEWCRDWHERAFYSRSPFDNPVLMDQPIDPGSGKVARGGAWNAKAWWSRSGVRTYDFAATPVHAKGFRVVIRGDLKSLATAPQELPFKDGH
jgi:serine/threonine protein kinase